MCAKFTCDGKRGFKQDTCYLFIHNSVSFLFLIFHYFKITRAVHSINLSIAELGEKLKKKICYCTMEDNSKKSSILMWELCIHLRCLVTMLEISILFCSTYISWFYFTFLVALYF
uniref:Uncharacterized protein n=1 Tax=Anguilla anguilla TaxID=7936 RepID=A0A0E9X2J2_ANGAN